MEKLSAIIIVKNEEKNIVEVIENVSFADEVIVIDNESDDDTIKLARRLGAIVFVKKFTDFSHQRNYALDKASGKWVLYVDADERVTPALKQEILASIKSPAEEITAYRLRRKNFYFGKHEWPYVEKILRLFLKSKIFGWSGIIHESPITRGKVKTLNSYLEHYSHRDLSSMVKKTNTWSKMEADLLFQSNHPQMNWWRFIRIMLTKFSDSYFKQGGWKVGTIGFIESMYQAYSYFIVYAKLWEKQLENKRVSKN